MDLEDTVSALRARNIEVAIDIGVHTRCTIDSNCPKAIELRQLITEAGVTLPQLLEGYVTAQAADPVNVREFIPAINVDGRVNLRIGDNTIPIDLTTYVRNAINSMVQARLGGLTNIEHQITELGKGLYSAYLNEISRQRTSRILPQLEFDQHELVETGCMYTKSGEGYVFYFPCEYDPDTVYHDGYHYRISDAHRLLIHREALVKLTVVKLSFTSAILCNKQGNKLQHYHGNAGLDCWGTVQLPRVWDRTLNQLYRLSISLSRAVGTVNYDSPLNRNPPGMPTLADLFSSSTRMGREGTMETARPEEAVLNIPHTGWGRTRRDQ